MPADFSPNEQPKYINTREIDIYKKGQILYGLNLALPEIRRSKTVYLAEGYMDVIALHQAGIVNAVAPCGTAFTDEQAKMLHNWAETIVLVFDSDEAGQTAAYKGIITCRKNNLACRLVVPGETEDGEKLKDPADILEKFDEKTLKNTMNRVIMDSEYLIARGIAQNDISTPRGKALLCEMLFPYIAVLGSASERDDCIGLVSDRIYVDKSSILNDFNKWLHNSRQSPEDPAYKEKTEKKISIKMNDELFLLIFVLVNPKLYPKLRSLVAIKDINDTCAKDIFVALEECFMNDESGTEDVLARISSVELKNFIIRRGISPEFKGDSGKISKKLMEDGINRVKIKKFRHRLEELSADMRMKERNLNISNDDDFTELIKEKMYIVNEIQKLEGR
jgi:DNA primase